MCPVRFPKSLIDQGSKIIPSYPNFESRTRDIHELRPISNLTSNSGTKCLRTTQETIAECHVFRRHTAENNYETRQQNVDRCLKKVWGLNKNICPYNTQHMKTGSNTKVRDRQPNEHRQHFDLNFANAHARRYVI